MQSVIKFLTTKLKLKVNEQKSAVARPEDRHFLGFRLRCNPLDGTVDVLISKRSKERIGEKIRELVPRNFGSSLAACIRRLNGYLQGWIGYFGISEYYRPIPELDDWLRRRVRMCYWKQWPNARTRVRHLLALGTFKRTAIWTAISRKSYWHLSRSLGTQTAMTNDWLHSQGLVSIRALWMKAHGYT